MKGWKTNFAFSARFWFNLSNDTKNLIYFSFGKQISFRCDMSIWWGRGTSLGLRIRFFSCPFKFVHNFLLKCYKSVFRRHFESFKIPYKLIFVSGWSMLSFWNLESFFIQESNGLFLKDTLAFALKNDIFLAVID